MSTETTATTTVAERIKAAAANADKPHQVACSFGAVYVRQLCGLDDLVEVSRIKDTAGVSEPDAIIAVAICEDDGSPCFDTTEEAVGFVCKLPSADSTRLVDKIYEVSGQLNKILDEELEDAKKL